MKILVIDIETAPNTVHVWGLFKQNVGINQILETGRVMCFAAKWLGEKRIFFSSEYHDGHEETIVRAHNLLSEADAVLTFNGDSFDLPTLNREFLKYGLAPPDPYAKIDLLRVAKRRFRFVSNKMDHLAGELGLDRKLSHSGHDLWIRCMEGDAAAWKEMRNYNIQDVAVLEQLYQKLLPWIDQHPNVGLYIDGDDPVCTNCGSTHTQSRGIQRNKTLSYQRFQCMDCDTWLRSRFPEKQAKGKILTQIGG